MTDYTLVDQQGVWELMIAYIEEDMKVSGGTMRYLAPNREDLWNMMSMDQSELRGNITTLLRVVMVILIDSTSQVHPTNVSGCHTYSSFELALPTE